MANVDSASDLLFCDLQACKSLRVCIVFTSSGAADSERKWLAELTTLRSVDFVTAVTQATMSEAILSEKDIRRAEILRAKREKFDKKRQLLSRLSPRAIAEATKKLAVKQEEKLQCFVQDRPEESQLAVTKASPAPPIYAATPLATPDAPCSSAAAPTTAPAAADKKINDGLETRLDSQNELDLPSPTFTCCLMSPGNVDDKGVKEKILLPRQLSVKEAARKNVPRNVVLEMEGQGVREGVSTATREKAEAPKNQTEGKGVREVA